MATFTKRIDADIRDVDSNFDGGSWASGVGAYSLGNPGLVTRNISLRFTSVNIPNASVINSAKITFRGTSTGSGLNVVIKIEGVDQDNTGEFVTSPEDTARTRTHTTANVGWTITSQTAGADKDTSDIKTIVQEIVDRAGWASGNAMAFWLSDNGSTSGDYVDFEDYSTSTTLCALLTIDYTETGSPSPSPTPSASPSLSPSLSPSASQSATPSPSSSVSPSPSQMDEFFGLRIIKPEAVAIGKNVFNTQEPFHYIFNSDYGTLKYYEKQTAQVTFDANAGLIGGSTSITHNLGYYPYVEVFVSVYIGSPTGIYEYCPFAGSGASVAYDANYKITTTGLTLYGQINGVSTSVWVFDFLVFIYKNNLNL